MIHWLTDKYRHIPIPQVVIEPWPGFNVGGAYYKPFEGCINFRSTRADAKNGIIFVNTAHTPETDGFASCLAHEFRHHLQHIRGYKTPSDWISTGNYQQDIINYFNKYWWEMNALLFENKFAPIDMSLMWYEWIIHDRERGE